MLTRSHTLTHSLADSLTHTLAWHVSGRSPPGSRIMWPNGEIDPWHGLSVLVSAPAALAVLRGWRISRGRVHAPIHLSIYPSIHLSIHSSIHPSAHTFAHVAIQPSSKLFIIRPPIHAIVRQRMCLRRNAGVSKRERYRATGVDGRRRIPPRVDPSNSAYGVRACAAACVRV